MTENIAGLPSNNYTGESVYRVKPLDRDSGGKSGEGFERHTRKDEKEESGDNTEQVSVIRDLEPAVIRDDMILSDSAKQVLESSGDTSPATVQQPPELAPLQGAPLPGERVVGSHIDITA